MGSDTVPELLRGGWRRSLINYADGRCDTTSTVVWLQLASQMVDVRFPSGLGQLTGRGSLEACSLDDLKRLAGSEGSSGFTICTPIVTNPEGKATATAEWFTRGHGIAFQPATAYPEPGLLEWNRDGSIMTERAPSGAYVEQWHRIPDSEKPLGHRYLDDGRQLYMAGSVAVLVRDRTKPVPRPDRLQTLVAEAGDDHDAVAALVDCEFSLAEKLHGQFVITHSTLPWRTGEQLDADL